MNGNYDSLIREQVIKAREKGITQPVIAVLSQQAPQACSIYQDVRGRPLQLPVGAEEKLVLLTLSLEEAVSLLRRHAGQGGRIAAEMLEDRIMAEYWIALLAPQDLHLMAFLNGKEVRRASMGYMNVSRRIHSLTDMLQDSGPSLLRTTTEDGEAVTVCGPCGPTTALATALVGIVLTRRWAIPHEGNVVSVPVNDNQLASLLIDVFGKDPKVIAEALMALKKMNGSKDRWLKKVLWGRPDLRPLAQQVRRELTGK